MIKLRSQDENTPLIIKKIDDGDLKARMYDMGLYPNQTIEIIKKAPFGDPIVVQVEGQLVMLRSNEADLIIVEETTTH